MHMSETFQLEAQDELTAMIRRFTAILAPEPRTTVTREEDLRGDLGYDSLRLIELSYVLEDAFVLEQISVEEAKAIQQVGDIEDIILQKMRERGYGFVNNDPTAAAALLSEAESWSH